MAQVFGTLCGFSSKPFLKQLASHVSAAMLQLKFPLKHFFGRFKSVLLGVNERQVITHKKIEKHDDKNMFL